MPIETSSSRCGVIAGAEAERAAPRWRHIRRLLRDVHPTNCGFEINKTEPFEKQFDET